MSLRTEQARFTVMIARLVTYADMRGYQLTYGDAYRDRRVFGAIGERKGYGNKDSNHKNRLAVDFNLFVDNKYITDSDHYAYLDLVQFWVSIGGSWIKSDANHWSIMYNGMR